MSMQRRVRNTLAISFLLAMAAIVSSFGGHASVARAENWVIWFNTSDIGGALSGFNPCSCCSWPGMHLVNFYLDEHGEWSACCHAPTKGDYVPYETEWGPNGPTGITYTANAPDVGYGTSGWFQFQFDQPVVNISTGQEAYYFYVDWTVTGYGSVSEYCEYTDVNNQTINTDCYH